MIAPPNRVDHVYLYACTRGPGGFKGNKAMSLEQLGFATKGIAHETGLPHADVVYMLSIAWPALSSSATSEYSGAVLARAKECLAAAHEALRAQLAERHVEAAT